MLKQFVRNGHWRIFLDEFGEFLSPRQLTKNEIVFVFEETQNEHYTIYKILTLDGVIGYIFTQDKKYYNLVDL